MRMMKQLHNTYRIGASCNGNSVDY
jgi:hypothetical protein